MDWDKKAVRHSVQGFTLVLVVVVFVVCLVAVLK